MNCFKNGLISDENDSHSHLHNIINTWCYNTIIKLYKVSVSYVAKIQGVKLWISITYATYNKYIINISNNTRHYYAAYSIIQYLDKRLALIK